MGLTVSDRISLDNRIDAIRQAQADTVTQRRADIEIFYATRMMPLEAKVDAIRLRQGRVMALALIAVCVASSSLLVQLARILAMGPSR